MGSYGIGVERAIAAIVECHHDERGIVWPSAVAPFAVTVVTAQPRDEGVRVAGERIYDNHFVIFGHLAWGKLRDYEVYEDTEKAQALDDYLEANEPALLAA